MARLLQTIMQQFACVLLLLTSFGCKAYCRPNLAMVYEFDNVSFGTLPSHAHFSKAFKRSDS